jgi:hypothetical protein
MSPSSRHALTMMMKPTLLLLVWVLLPWSACADVVSTQLLGHWRYTDANRSGDYEFHDDGTYTANIAQDGKIVWEGAGKWSLDGNSLTCDLMRSSPERIPIGTKDTDKIVEINKDYYLIEARDGSKHKYTRVPNFETANINIGYLSQESFGERMTVQPLADYIKRLQGICTDFFVQAATQEDLDIVVAVKPGQLSRVWFVSSRTPAANEKRDQLRTKLEAIPPPATKGGPIAFAIRGRIARGSGKDPGPPGPPPTPKEWQDLLSKQKSESLSFDGLMRLVWPDPL